MKIFFLSFFLICSSNLIAQNNEWIFIETGADNTKYFFKQNTEKTAWTKAESQETIYFDKDIKKTIDGYHLSLWKYDCDERQIGIIQKNTYTKNGKLVNSFTLKSYEIEMNYVVPDSIGESLINSFCQK